MIKIGIPNNVWYDNKLVISEWLKENVGNEYGYYLLGTKNEFLSDLEYDQIKWF
jgi:hypothetical protein